MFICWCFCGCIFFSSFRYMPKSSTVKSCKCMHSFVKCCQTNFKNRCPILQWMRVSVAPHLPSMWWLQCSSWILAILIGVLWYLIVILTCVFLMIYGFGHLFICLFAIFMYILGEVSVKVLSPFWKLEFVFFNSPLSDMWIAIFFFFFF